MIIRGGAIHRDEHGRCGLLPTQSFFLAPAPLATPSTIPVPDWLPSIPSNVRSSLLYPSRKTRKEGLNFSLMVTPTQEYGIAVPAGPVGLGETSY